MEMTTKSLAHFLQKVAVKNKSSIAGCPGCMVAPFGGFGADAASASPVKAAPHASDGPDEPGFFDSIPWPWVIGTLVVSVPATAFLTYKMTESMAKSKLGLKLFERSTAAKRKKKKKGKRK